MATLAERADELHSYLKPFGADGYRTYMLSHTPVELQDLMVPMVNQDLAGATAMTPPANSTAPVVTGSPTIGQTLTVVNGNWVGSSPTYTYQWYRSGNVIAGATGTTYLLVSADAGTMVGCRVTATNTVGSASANSNQIFINFS